MNGSINPLFIAAVVSFLGKPCTSSMHSRRAAPPPCSMPPAFKSTSAFQTSQRYSGYLSAVGFFATKENFCYHWALSVQPRSSATDATRAMSPQPVQDQSFPIHNREAGHIEQPVTVSPAILNPLFISKTWFHPRRSAELLLAPQRLHTRLCGPVSWVSSSLMA